MNITLSVDRTVIERARAYATAHDTSINQLVRDYLSGLVASESPQEHAALFAATARNAAGRSSEGWRFKRETIHRYDS